MAMEFAMALWGIYTFIMGINEKKGWLIDLNHKHREFWDSRYMYKFDRLSKKNNHWLHY